MQLIFIDNILPANKEPREQKNRFLRTLLLLSQRCPDSMLENDHTSFSQIPSMSPSEINIPSFFSSLVCLRVSKQLRLKWEHTADLFPQLNNSNKSEALLCFLLPGAPRWCDETSAV